MTGRTSADSEAVPRSVRHLCSSAAHLSHNRSARARATCPRAQCQRPRAQGLRVQKRAARAHPKVPPFGCCTGARTPPSRHCCQCPPASQPASLLLPPPASRLALLCALRAPRARGAASRPKEQEEEIRAARLAPAAGPATSHTALARLLNVPLIISSECASFLFTRSVLRARLTAVNTALESPLPLMLLPRVGRVWLPRAGHVMQQARRRGWSIGARRASCKG